MTIRVMIVEDEPDLRDALAQTLELADLDPLTASSFVAAKDRITAEFDGVILSDIRMPGRDGFHLLKYAQKIDPDLPVILLTGEGDVPMAVKGMSAGAYDFLEKPCAAADLVASVQKALKTRALVLENRRLKSAAQEGDAAGRLIFGESALARTLRDRVRAVARTRAEVLILGAPGSGISKVAEVIHLLSDRASAPFVKLSAASADAKALGQAIDRAAAGSLFIGEIADLTPPLQATLLERLEGEIDARIIAGSFRALDTDAAEGQFNPDLFYRLDLMRVRIPSLSERPEDIPLLFRKYVAQAAEQAALDPPEITSDTLARIMAQDWPGNARALMNAAMRFAMGVEDRDPGADLGLNEQMAQVERSLLIQALRQAKGHATSAAQALKLPRKTFYDKLTRHDLKPEDFR
ncbi:sigma-54-dependent Fis family transcriptional regulator [Maribius pontilimi]|uniref:Sigma-54-dependent Fis family transcriptional regulator n=1 Tax=Palleronia pontilimi TaxID=1964209 RepID=A0A934M972_9RHOB|nr:sigma-54 dependent transcriptional regulator [Palleronia pontilimi]MBJ3762212.1 sigma-54-dependent Fis family transcriptional regulator [Palleronia pontilimi]